MNTLDISNNIDMRHYDITRWAEKNIKTKLDIEYREVRGKETLTYNIDEKDFKNAPWATKVKLLSIEKKLADVEKEFEDFKFGANKQFKLMNERIDKLEKENKEQKEDLEVLRKENKFLRGEYERARRVVSATRAVSALGDDALNKLEKMLNKNKTSEIPNKTLLKLRGMLHPDKLDKDINAPFLLINDLIGK